MDDLPEPAEKEEKVQEVQEEQPVVQPVVVVP